MMLVFYVLSVNFAFTDWVMALEPHWYSTIFGLWFIVGQGLLANGLVTLVTFLGFAISLPIEKRSPIR